MPKKTGKAAVTEPVRASDAAHFDPWMDTQKVADYTGYHVSTIRELIRLRSIGASKLGKGRGRWLVRLSEVNRWMKSREIKHSAHAS